MKLKKDQVEKLEKLLGQLGALYDEIGALSKKNPSDAVNTFKLTLINKALTNANELLGAKFKPFEDFDKFVEETVPTTSDVNFIIAQYAAALNVFRSSHIYYSEMSASWFYSLSDSTEKITTAPPASVSRKF